jgi:hypothetical protein
MVSNPSQANVKVTAVIHHNASSNKQQHFNAKLLGTHRHESLQSHATGSVPGLRCYKKLAFITLRLKNDTDDILLLWMRQNHMHIRMIFCL